MDRLAGMGAQAPMADGGGGGAELPSTGRECSTPGHRHLGQNERPRAGPHPATAQLMALPEPLCRDLEQAQGRCLGRAWGQAIALRWAWALLRKDGRKKPLRTGVLEMEPAASQSLALVLAGVPTRLFLAGPSRLHFSWRVSSLQVGVVFVCFKASLFL